MGSSEGCDQLALLGASHCVKVLEVALELSEGYQVPLGSISLDFFQNLSHCLHLVAPQSRCLPKRRLHFI